jgi:AI-2 transport protein TqsA
MTQRLHPLVLVAAALIVTVGLRYAEPFCVPVLCGLALAATSSPIATWVTRQGLPSAVGALAALLVDVAILVLLGFVLMLAGGELREKLPAYLVRLSAFIIAIADALTRRGVSVDATEISVAVQQLGASFVQSAAVSAVGLMSTAIVVLLVVFFTLCEFVGLGDKILRVVGDPEHRLVRVDRIVREVQKYLLVKVLSSFIIGTLAFVLLKLLRVDMALLLALILFILHLVPNVGSVIATVPAVLVALVTRGAATAGAVAASYLFINMLVGNVVEPRVLGRTLGLSPLVLMLGMLFWGWLWGTPGALLSVPLMVVAKIVLENSKDLAWVARVLEPASEGRAPLPRPRVPTGSLLARHSIPMGLGASVPDRPREAT